MFVGSLIAVQITATDVLPEPELLARLQALSALPPATASRVAVQLRDPELPSRALHALGVRLRDVTAAAGAALIVNDRLDLALLLGAEGVHLGRRSVAVADARALLGETAFVSVACHDVEDVARAAAAGADAAMLSPIFATPGKGPPLGLDALRAARRRIEDAQAASGRAMTLVALGGIDAQSAPACLAAGADAVAAIRADLLAGAAALLDRTRGAACSRP